VPNAGLQEVVALEEEKVKPPMLGPVYIRELNPVAVEKERKGISPRSLMYAFGNTQVSTTTRRPSMAAPNAAPSTIRHTILGEEVLAYSSHCR
jgi:hypothetical protein